MYQCDECGKVFDNPQKVKEIHYELEDRAEETFYCCPFCDSDNYCDIVQCDECGEYINKELKTTYITFPNGDIVCDDCLHDYCEYKICQEAI